MGRQSVLKRISLLFHHWYNHGYSVLLNPSNFNYSTKDSPQDTIRYEFGSCVVNTRTLGRNGQAIVIQCFPACVFQRVRGHAQPGLLLAICDQESPLVSEVFTFAFPLSSLLSCPLKSPFSIVPLPHALPPSPQTGRQLSGCFLRCHVCLIGRRSLDNTQNTIQILGKTNKYTTQQTQNL